MSCPELRPNGRGVPGPVVAVIMDGVGIGRGDEADAVFAANTPNLDRYAGEALTTRLNAHGRAVGLPSEGDMGNSEVGHNALGSGRIFDQGAKLVHEAIQSRRLFDGEVWRRLVSRCVEGPGALHFIGLLSDGNVHSHIDHLIAMVQRADSEGVAEVYIHALLDGRDVPKRSALEYVEQIEAALAAIDCKADRRYRIASGGGRMTTTMDRYQADWSIVERGWGAHVRGQGRGFASLREAVETLRNQEPGGIDDQNLPHFVIVEGSEPVARINDGDAVITFNFRGDRMLEICQAFEQDELTAFDRGTRPRVHFAGMMLYDGDTQTPAHYLVSPPQITCTLGEMLTAAGVGQLACSETQKYGHVTYFWNGNRTGAFDPTLEKYIEVPSHPPPFDARPEMRANEITERVVAELATGRYRSARLNYANGDMVGHTGNFGATVRAVEAVDRCLGELERAVVGMHGALIVTADHGNADDMAERDAKTGAPRRDASGQLVAKTSHSLNPVVFHVVMAPQESSRFALADLPEPGLGHVAATMACLLGYEQPDGYLPSLLRTL